MIPITLEELKLLIEEGRRAGKDVSGLIDLRVKLDAGEKLPDRNYIHFKKSDDGKTTIYSTGRVCEEDFR